MHSCKPYRTVASIERRWTSSACHWNNFGYPDVAARFGRDAWLEHTIRGYAVNQGWRRNSPRDEDGLLHRRLVCDRCLHSSRDRVERLARCSGCDMAQRRDDVCQRLWRSKHGHRRTDDSRYTGGSRIGEQVIDSRRSERAEPPEQDRSSCARCEISPRAEQRFHPYQDSPFDTTC
jgi:hypothetical protein